MILWELFIAFLQIGAFSFGGGYAALPLLQNQVVTIHGWLSVEEFNHLVTISQMTPGPIAINSATFIGIRVAGPLGAVVATTASVLPSCILVTLITFLYVKYKDISLLQSVLSVLRPAVIALIAGAGLSILLTSIFGVSAQINLAHFNWAMAAIFLLCLVLLKKGYNAIGIMFLAGILNMIQANLFQ
ncbi:chromate transporter [Vaginisenegalia massiliensis]|uniref:chromate transporter n=1 Tax=Vaginisenegalia massiliensis TaxID=2058294 RepID=UPI000F5434F9|nr:chromate transporter [Vaginisenegalia massiliensis]